MRRLLPFIMLAVTACTGSGGAWPTLTRRPVEGPPAAAGSRRCAVAAGPASCLPGGKAVAASSTATPPAAPTPTVAIDDIAAKLVVIDRDLTDTAARLAAQRTLATTAATAARGTAPRSEAWAKAQIELTALDRIGNQIGDLRGRLDAVAGTLAAASAGGGDVTALLATTGRLIARTTVAQADYDTAAAALR